MSGRHCISRRTCRHWQPKRFEQFGRHFTKCPLRIFLTPVVRFGERHQRSGRVSLPWRIGLFPEFLQGVAHNSVRRYCQPGRRRSRGRGEPDRADVRPVRRDVRGHRGSGGPATKDSRSSLFLAVRLIVQDGNTAADTPGRAVAGRSAAGSGAGCRSAQPRAMIFFVWSSVSWRWFGRACDCCDGWRASRPLKRSIASSKHWSERCVTSRIMPTRSISWSSRRPCWKEAAFGASAMAIRADAVDAWDRRCAGRRRTIPEPGRAEGSIGPFHAEDEADRQRPRFLVGLPSVDVRIERRPVLDEAKMSLLLHAAIVVKLSHRRAESRFRL